MFSSNESVKFAKALAPSPPERTGVVMAAGRGAALLRHRQDKSVGPAAAV